MDIYCVTESLQEDFRGCGRVKGIDGVNLGGGVETQRHGVDDDDVRRACNNDSNVDDDDHDDDGDDDDDDDDDDEAK